MSTNYIKNVAIVGAGGNCGKYIAEALLKSGKHTVTGITRANSTNKLPEGLEVKTVDYDDQSSLTEALRGQDALIITMSVTAGPEQQSKLIKAAADANVPWILPNEWGFDTDNQALVNDIPGVKTRGRAEIKETGKSSYIAVSTGFWYEWSLAIGPAYGFDFAKREVTLFDEGETKITTSTWPQVGRAVAALLSLPIKAEGQDREQRCLERFRDSMVYVSSFTVSQKDMLDSVLRVTGTGIDAWKITKEPSHKRYADGIEAMKGGDRMGFVRMMYTRVFYPNDDGNTEKTKGTINKVLGLPEEDLDEATRAAIERAKTSAFGSHG